TQLRQLVALSPHHAQLQNADFQRFARMIRSYREERERAGEWLRTFEAPKTALTTAIEHYEWAELCAELGVVGSSIALLFASRRVWWSTLALGCAGLLLFVLTFFPTSHQVHAAEEAISAAKTKVDALGDTAQADEAEDDALLQEIEGRAP